MAVHVPLSPEAQAEAKILMLASNNLLKLQDGKPVAIPSQDMILGNYYLTVDVEGEPGEGKIFSNVDEVMMAYDEGVIGLHSAIKVRVTKEINGEKNLKSLMQQPEDLYLTVIFLKILDLLIDQIQITCSN